MQVHTFTSALRLAFVRSFSRPAASFTSPSKFSLKDKVMSASASIILIKSHSKARLQILFCLNKLKATVTQKDVNSRSPKQNNKWHFLYLSHCIRAPSLRLCLWFSRLQPQWLGRDWFKYHPISLTCTDRAARANYIHLVMWLGFQVVNILWQHASPAAAETHQCSYIIPQIWNIPLNTHSSRSWQYKHEKWVEGETGGNPHIDMSLLW